ncbi:MAG: adenosine deaminase [Erysipelotrichaceae bacterium]|nr:adenosine deaminase [Erysipelotrichaceae bacterium]
MRTAYVELHLHLDGSIWLPWAYETALKRGVIEPDMTFQQYYDRMYFNDYKTREEGFKKFEYPCDVMQTREDLHDSVYHLIDQLNKRGLIYAEIRFASQQHCKLGLTQAEVVEAVCEGVKDAARDFPNIKTGIINCLMHKGPDANFNMKENYETIEATKMYMGKGVVGIDLAGFENNGDYMLYEPLIRKAKEYGIPVTMHAGEMGDGSHVPMAIKMGADRIGHGVHCVDNPEWLQMVVDTQIPLEVCVSSNVKQARNYAAHPVRKLIEAGAKVTLNSDNMMFTRTDIINEHHQLLNIGVTEEQLMQCTINAIEASFADEETKKELLKKIGR